MISTLGSHLSGGAVYMLSLNQPLVLRSGIPMIGDNMEQIASFRGTVWTADCSSDGSQVFIGTNLGVALVNVETRTQSWVCRCKSDVFSVQLDHSERIALCGLRNGAIVTVDVRQKPDSHARLTRQRTLLHSKGSGTPSRSNTDTKHWFEVRGNIYHSDTVSMPSSVSCLTSLKLYDQYFLASSMDGSIKLYDHRMAQRGAVQSCVVLRICSRLVFRLEFPSLWSLNKTPKPLKSPRSVQSLNPGWVRKKLMSPSGRGRYRYSTKCVEKLVKLLVG